MKDDAALNMIAAESESRAERLYNEIGATEVERDVALDALVSVCPVILVALDMSSIKFGYSLKRRDKIRMLRTFAATLYATYGAHSDLSDQGEPS